ncbi:spore cortex-lytic enzyme [Clostridium cylindrosporum]|uniref:Spore cortex-lytic enzyme n=1 Tax=Clostridium cylindrosporum DSM 605 TaxID=1121307 RepID=A0A0J8DEY5_CLOCY|nr:spore cortex-lytic enzyme [Clostridium cylindrosporum]KMT22814.1 spore cortex-lytic enzyme [Clostridium cylindrosporum DSM 605]
MRKLSLFLMLSLIVLFSGISITDYRKSTGSVPVAIYNVGSSSSTIKKLEQNLKWLGFFNGTPDNYYGYDTFEAVKKLQRDRGIKVDGIAGDKTLATLGISSGSSDKDTKPSDSNKEGSTSLSRTDELLLARAINGESRGEPYEGQVAVGAVIMNRVSDARFPNSVAGVVYQPGAFSSINDGQINADLEAAPKKAARDAINGWDPSGGCLYFYNPAKTQNKWIRSRPIVIVIGSHRFTK